MASRKTQHYNLSLWDKTDPIQREDFNADHEAIDAAIAGGIKIANGSYTGNGSYGENSPIVLTFDFPPKIVIVFAEKGENYFTVFLPGKNNYFRSHTSSNRFGYIIQTDLSESTLRYYGKTDYSGSDTVKVQGNESGKVYQYIAIG